MELNTKLKKKKQYERKEKVAFVFFSYHSDKQNDIAPEVYRFLVQNGDELRSVKFELC